MLKLLTCNAAAMKSEFEPFAHPDPFDIPAGDGFAGWPAQILFEIKELLFDCSSDWLTAVASHIHELARTNRADRVFDDPNGARESLAHSESGQFSLYRQPGYIGVFAALEPSVAWDKIEPPTERWQRYAVFALMYLRDSVKILERRDRLQRTGRATSADNKYLALDLSEASAWALEAMRALQIAHSLRIDARAKSARGRKAAVARHVVFVSLKAEALEMADSRPFKTKEQALDYITSNLLIDSANNKFCSRSAASKWLREAGWKAGARREQ
ncbi:hypothetical protein [Hydrogenophaga sp. PML113]|uniref:hypothetical protein n=1 Tax=Hydrogenophaga sp. PML113 TaxID=1899350 RepID=UPI0011131723|nr:hypothetical protein [Hydrogenophaga sp. PML113]